MDYFVYQFSFKQIMKKSQNQLKIKKVKKEEVKINLESNKEKEINKAILEYEAQLILNESENKKCLISFLLYYQND